MAHEHFYVKRSEKENLIQPELIYTGLLEDAPNWFNIQHSHDFCEILYVADGAGEAVLEGKKFRLAPGDLWWSTREPFMRKDPTPKRPCG